MSVRRREIARVGCGWWVGGGFVLVAAAGVEIENASAFGCGRDRAAGGGVCSTLCAAVLGRYSCVFDAPLGVLNATWWPGLMSLVRADGRFGVWLMALGFARRGERKGLWTLFVLMES